MPGVIKKAYPVTVHLARRQYALLLIISVKKGQSMAEVIRRFTTDGLEQASKWLFEGRSGVKVPDDNIDAIIEEYSRSKRSK